MQMVLMLFNLPMIKLTINSSGIMEPASAPGLLMEAGSLFRKGFRVRKRGHFIQWMPMEKIKRRLSVSQIYTMLSHGHPMAGVLLLLQTIHKTWMETVFTLSMKMGATCERSQSPFYQVNNCSILIITGQMTGNQFSSSRFHEKRSLIGQLTKLDWMTIH